MPPPPSPATAPHPRSPQRVLIVRPSALGDVSRTVPCLVALRHALPKAQIDWLVNTAFADAVSAHPMLNDVIPFNRQNPRSIPGLLRRLRAQRYDLVIDLQGLARSGLFTRATGAARRIGFANAREGAWLAYNEKHDQPRDLHTVDRMRGLLNAAGFPGPADLTLYVPAAAARDVAAATANWKGPYACLAPTARWGCKCWPVERFAAVGADALASGRVQRLVVVASPQERRRVQAGFAAALPADLRDRVTYPDTHVSTLMAWIAGARALLGNDSAALHLAVGLNRPTVSLFGPTDPARVGPCRWTPTHAPAAEHRVIRAPGTEGRTIKYRRHKDDDTLMRDIQIATVRDALGNVLDATAESYDHPTGLDPDAKRC